MRVISVASNSKLDIDSNITSNNYSGTYKLFNIRYAQYIKTDIDMRIYNVVDKHSNLVYRMYAGIGIPYKNSYALPFEKSYFAGGANGIRAWQSRKLGPGSFYSAESNPFELTGDIQLEGNLEYRFDLIKVLEGAVFVDAGNIWLLKKDTIREGANFELNRFYKEIAIGSGIGFRVDLNFFIIRLDMGVPLRKPNLPELERWFFQQKNGTIKNFINPVFNIGIGYPF